jgi:type II secretory pathway pseudopilin PulG
MRHSREPKPKRRSEDGFTLIGVIILLGIFMIFLAVALPRVREEVRRDQEIETMHRGEQYIRAVKLYYRRFHRFPADVEGLYETNGLRFLRNKYSDPLTGKDDWRPVYLGQNKAPLTMGFFGTVRNLGAAAPPGNGPLRGDQIIGAAPPDPSPTGVSDSNQANQNDPGSTAGQVFGGGPLIGFSPSSAKQSILIYKTKGFYDEWEFVYDPASDRMVQGWLMPTYVPPPNTGAPGVGPNPRTP